MDKGTAITNLNNAVRLVYLTYDYAANIDCLEPQKKETLEQEIVEHTNIILNSLARTSKTISIEPYQNSRRVEDEEVGSMARGDT